MIDPKQFYRKMDRMLAQIASDGQDHDFLQTILDELVSSFGGELKFGNGHLYRELFGEFELLHVTGGTDIFPARISADDRAAQFVLKHGSFLFESEFEIPDWYNRNPQDAAEFVGFIVNGPPGHRFMFLFTLQEGWIRDEIAFCLNGVRFSLNYRIKSDAAQNELATAANIQRSLLPEKAPEFKGWDIAARYQPAEEVGGDLYDFIHLSDDLLGIAVGDASGHGLPAALLVRDVLMGIRMGVGTNLKMLYAMRKLNRVLHKTTFSTRFISVFYGELQQGGGLLYANAGHTSGLILTEDETISLDPTGPIMGPLPDIPIERAYAHIPEGAIMVLYTDGITERVLPDGSPWDTEGLIASIKQNAHLCAAEIVDNVFEYALSLEHESDVFEDDSTLLIIKHNAPPPSGP